MTAGPERAWAGALGSILDNLSKAERLGLPGEAVPVVEAFERSLASYGLSLSSVKTPLTYSADSAVRARGRRLKSQELRRVGATLTLT